MGKPVIYQVIVRLFGNTNEFCIPNSSLEINGCGKFNDFTSARLHSIKELGCSHIWFTGVIEHSTLSDFSNFGIAANHPSVVKGIAGSPYSITDYYNVSPALAVNVEKRLSEFESLIKRTHEAGMKAIIDFVPNHISRQYKSHYPDSKIGHFGESDNTSVHFSPSNNFYYLPGERFKPPFQKTDIDSYDEYPAKVTGNDCFRSDPSISDWYETVKLNYGVDYINGMAEHFHPIPDTWLKMRDILTYWISKGVDGFRCDMVGMVPVAFWRWVIKEIKKINKETVFIGEIYEPHRYSEYLDIAGFNFLYNKVGLYDTLYEILKFSTSTLTITECWQKTGTYEERLLNFVENHDEVRLASEMLSGSPFKALPAAVVSLMLSNAPFMLYFGQELGERGMDQEGFSGLDGRTSIFDYWSLKSVREWLKGTNESQIRSVYKRLLAIAVTERAVYMGKRFDLQYANHFSGGYNVHKQYSFARSYEDTIIIISVDFSQQERCFTLSIPSEMFSYFGIQDNSKFNAIDLITGFEFKTTLSSQSLFELSSGNFGINIIKLSLQ